MATLLSKTLFLQNCSNRYVFLLGPCISVAQRGVWQKSLLSSSQNPLISFSSDMLNQSLHAEGMAVKARPGPFAVGS